jgi:hypothetical protein
MSYKGLLNMICSWTRLAESGTRGDYGEPIHTTTTVATGVLCREQDITRQEAEELGLAGEVGKEYRRLFVDGNQDLQIGDLITILTKKGVAFVDDGYERKVRKAPDAAGHGHHDEAILELTKTKT